MSRATSSPRRRWGRRVRLGVPAALSQLALALGGCEPPGVTGPDRHRATVAIDARALLAGHGGPVSVIEQAELTVTDAEGGRTVARQPLTVDEPVAVFEVRVGAGPHRFDGRVISNDGTVLFEGSRAVDVRADGFVVEIVLRPVAGVLVVTPDSIGVRGGGQFVGAFTMENRGSERLTWQVIPDPPSPSCDGPCLELRPAGGDIGPGGSVTLQVAPFGPPGLDRVRIASTVGSVELKVVVDAPFGTPGG